MERLETTEQVTVYAKYLAGEVVIESETVVQVVLPSSLDITGAEKVGENVFWDREAGVFGGG